MQLPRIVLKEKVYTQMEIFLEIIVRLKLTSKMYTKLNSLTDIVFGKKRSLSKENVKYE